MANHYYIYKDLFELARYIKSKNNKIVLSITTNGELLDDNNIELLLKYFDWLTISVDASTDELNKELGRTENHFTNTIKLLEKVNNKILIKINTVAMSKNLDDITNMHNKFSSFNIARWKIFRFWDIKHNAKENSKIYSISDNEDKLIRQKLDELNQNSNIDIHYNDYIECITSYFRLYADGSIEGKGGQVVANILDDSIENILKNEELDLSTSRYA